MSLDNITIPTTPLSVPDARECADWATWAESNKGAISLAEAATQLPWRYENLRDSSSDNDSGGENRPPWGGGLRVLRGEIPYRHTGVPNHSTRTALQTYTIGFVLLTALVQFRIRVVIVEMTNTCDRERGVRSIGFVECKTR